MKTIILISISILFVVFIISYLYISLRAARFINFVPKRDFAKLYRLELMDNVEHSIINMKGENINIDSRYGYSLNGKLFKKENSDKYIIIIHGYNSAYTSSLKYVDFYKNLGFNCLLINQRRTLDTGGKGISFGYYERYDVESWMDYIYTINQKAEIGLFGISLGAATAILVAEFRPDVKFIIPYCSYSSFKKIMIDKGKKEFKYIRPFYSCMVIGAYIRLGARLDKIDLRKSIKNVDCPILIMHSKTDNFTPYSHALELKEANPKAEFKYFDGPPHARSYTRCRKEFEKYVTDFLNNQKLL